MRWKDYMFVVKELTSNVLKLVDNADLGSLVAGNVSIKKEKLVEVISENETLVGWIATHCTNLTDAQVNDLTGTEMVELLDAAVALNLSERFMTAAKKVAGSLGEVLGSKTAVKTSTRA